ncbi:MAG: SOS response-associated peptidase family protein [Cryobacterium sp.]|nr:SOS response-associated peptidase family protein [Oligoflexia bacterium]
MCYSALVLQNVKKLGYQYKARVQTDLFEDLFRGRLSGSGAKIPRAMEQSFLDSPTSAPEMRIAQAIREFRRKELTQLQEEIGKQTTRLGAAEKNLLTKVTKKAREDQRISLSKIKNADAKIQRLENEELSESDSRIFPGLYAPLLLDSDGERVIRPFRYHLRPSGQPASFDRKFDGTYNARRDSLAEKFWWKSVYGKNHGVMVIRAFYENVALHDFEHRALAPGESASNLILRFDPQGLDEMLVPCIFDRNHADNLTLDSFALITDEPNPEVAAAGHQRTPIVLREEYLDLWLQTKGKPLSGYEKVFDDKQPTYFAHEQVA